jgi:hypothetical protein
LKFEKNNQAMKKKKDILLLTVLVFMYSLAVGQHRKSDESRLLDDAVKSIAESNAIYFESFVKNDSSIFIQRYAKDACILAPNAPAVCGQEAVTDFFKSAYTSYGLRSGKFITIAVCGDGKEFVTEEGLWQSFDAKENLFDNGKFLVL